MKLPPLDAHAHVSPQVSGRDLEDLGAVVLIATRSADEFESVRGRKDLVTVWGAGCHPSLVGAQREFDIQDFRSALESTPYVAEVGLDGESRVPIEGQIEVLESILNCLRESPRLASLHSFRATGQLLGVLGQQLDRRGVILHWWLGTTAETLRAVKLGCHFSINYSMIRATNDWHVIPLDRLLVETDHPSGDRFSSKPRQPGRVQDVERAIAEHHGITTEELRLQLWRNFAALVSSTGTMQMFPPPVRKMLQFVASRTS
ncbi:TatD family hydrolase [Agromyces sp. ISL-38]|uniref:TatD family hydrolase n=1 Tax=Agromyces sp. ISL-38 TaxID=2819107 RepID=UPI001BE70C69|nr:TatD family hydrolase [Agromyces sp. ISL-38]MBT2498068.1 TatD family hydrolase [Agromyces sp. ISL-38]